METEKHIETLSYRMKKVGEEALLELPIGIILINDKQLVEWANPFMQLNICRQDFDRSNNFSSCLKHFVKSLKKSSEQYVIKIE